MIKITASTGKVFQRIHDGFVMGREIYLGFDYSTGVKRPDLPEYYQEVDMPDEEITDTEALEIITGNET
jgi:hypothetical protein